MAELADAPDLGSGSSQSAGSTPVTRTSGSAGSQNRGLSLLLICSEGELMEPSFVIAVSAAILLLTFGAIGIVHTFKEEKQRQENFPEDVSDIEQPPVELTQYIRVTVVDYHCGVESVGKFTKNYFTVIFETDTHETLEYNVPEEMYDGFEKGQTGTLTVVDDYIYGFTLDET